MHCSHELIVVHDDHLFQIWVEPERPRYLRVVIGGLKELHLEKIHPTCGLSWAISLLGAAPLLETLRIEVCLSPLA